jgi:hypothetical protein
MADWLRNFFVDVRRGPSGADAGVDIEGPTVAAQVKFHRNRVGRPDVQRLHGAAEGRSAMFFSWSGYSKHAEEWADDNGIALFTYDLAGNVQSANDAAEDLIAEHEEAKSEQEERRRFGRLTHEASVGIAERWLARKLPGPVSRAGGAASDPVHLASERLAVAVCLSPTNAVGRPRLENLVAAANGRQPVFFVSVPKGLSAHAMSWADTNDVAVFGFMSEGRVETLNYFDLKKSVPRRRACVRYDGLAPW